MALGVIPLGRTECGQKLQAPNPPSPGNGCLQHATERAQHARLDERAVTGACGIAVDTPCTNVRATASLDGIVQTQRYRASRHERVQQSQRQPVVGYTWRPEGAVEDPMKGQELPFLGPSHHPLHSANHPPPVTRTAPASTTCNKRAWIKSEAEITLQCMPCGQGWHDPSLRQE